MTINVRMDCICRVIAKSNEIYGPIKMLQSLLEPRFARQCCHGQPGMFKIDSSNGFDVHSRCRRPWIDEIWYWHLESAKELSCEMYPLNADVPAKTSYATLLLVGKKRIVRNVTRVALARA
jgi:hypothetical protein